MKIIKGDLWDSKDDYILVTTNATIKKNGAVVMGRGAAKELSIIRPNLPFLFGSLITNIQDSNRRYGVGWELSNSSPNYGIFQVKYDWWDNADLNLILFSTEKLIEHCNGVLQNYKISMNFPGIGNGRLSYDEVLPIISKLPDNVSLYIKV